MPLNNEAHEKRLQERGMYSESQINWTLNRAEMYAEHNRMHPGFFDMMINSGKYPLTTAIPQEAILQLFRPGHATIASSVKLGDLLRVINWCNVKN